MDSAGKANGKKCQGDTEKSSNGINCAEAGTPFSLTNLLFALAQSPNFWLGLLFVGGSAFVWFDRRFKLRTFGI